MPYPLVGRSTILIVDDVASLRRTVMQMLSTAGYRVYEAASTDEALAVLRTGADRVDLVLTDIVMPGGTGDVLYRQVREEFPGVPVLFMSAYAPASLLAQGFPLLEHYVLQKPFTPARLLALVEAALESPDKRPAQTGDEAELP